MADSAREEKKARKRAAFLAIAHDLERKALSPRATDEFRKAALSIRNVALNAADRIRVTEEPPKAKRAVKRAR